MWDRGKLVVVGIFVAAVALGSFAWWYHFQQVRRTREFWGPTAANLIQRAAYVELLRLDDSPSAGDASDDGAEADSEEPAPELLSAGEQTLVVIERADVTGAPGLLHARHALVQDANFAWQPSAPPCAGRWEFALIFRDGDQTATVLFNPTCQRVRLAGPPNTAQLAEPLMRSFAELTAEWFEYAAEKRPGS